MSATDNTIDLNLAREVATYFALSEAETEKVISKICKTVSENREHLATQYGLSRGAIDYAPRIFPLINRSVSHPVEFYADWADGWVR